MGKIIVVTSGKGGVGKTTLTANVGIALSKLGEKTVVIDTDMGLRNLDLALGLENLVLNDIIDVATGECKLRDAVIRDSKIGQLAFLPASQIKSTELLTDEQYAEILRSLSKRFDYVLVDSPAGIDKGFETAVSVCDMVIVVVNPDPYSLRDADKVVGICEGRGISDIRLVINRMRPDMVRSGIMLNIDSIIESLGIRLIGVVEEERQMVKYCIEGTPAVLQEKSKSGKVFTDIARRIKGENVPVVDYKRKSGLFGIFK